MKKKNLLPILALAALGVLASCGGSTDKSDAAIDSLVANMVSVEGGTFRMGATEEQQQDVKSDEQPVHEVTLSTFSIGRYEVTQAQWQAIMGDNPSKTQQDDFPVTNVSWDDCQQFILKLNERTGRHFRLPTEAEWEYAARGGKNTTGAQFPGEASNHKRVGWCADNSGYKPHAVGGKQPNELGLYDMAGNVWEWCQDWYGDYTADAATDPHGPAEGFQRCDRGGAWDSNSPSLRTSFRDSGEPGTRAENVGFRLAE